MVAMMAALAEECLRLFVPAFYASAICLPDAVYGFINGGAGRGERVGELAAGGRRLCVAAAGAVHAPVAARAIREERPAAVGTEPEGACLRKPGDLAVEGMGRVDVVPDVEAALVVPRLEGALVVEGALAKRDGDERHEQVGRYLGVAP